MVPVPSHTVGTFYDGDCYVVLAVSGRAGLGAQQTAKPMMAMGREHKAGAVGESISRVSGASLGTLQQSEAYVGQATELMAQATLVDSQPWGTI